MNGRTARIVGIVVAVLATGAIGVLTQIQQWWWLSIPAAVLIAYEIFLEVRVPKARIEMLLRMVHACLDSSSDDKVRCGFLKPGRFGRHIVKVTSYGDGRFKRQRRTIRAGIGTAGRAFSWGKEVCLPSVLTRPDDTFEEVMLRDWGFTRHEAAQLQTDRRSYYSLPFINERREVLGVICVDSCTPDFTNPERVESIHWFSPFFRAILEGKE